MLTLGEMVRRSARPDTFGAKVALAHGDVRMTYADVNKRVNRIADVLLRLGVGKGDRVAVLGRNSVEYACIIFALAKIGAIMVPLNIWYKGDEIVYAVRQSGCRFFLLDVSFREMVETVQKQLDRVERYVYFGGDATHHEPHLAHMTEKASSDEPAVEVSEDDPRVIMYTSGTTGFPKGATLSHRQNCLHALIYALETGVTERDIGLLIYPLFHTGGSECLLMPFFLAGATVVVVERPDPEEILKAIEREKATFVYCVPTVWRRILRAMDGRGFDVSSVRNCVSASDTIRREDLEAIKARFKAPVAQFYGLTEAGVVTHFLKPQYHEMKLGSVGRAHPLVDVRIVNSDGNDVVAGDVGEIIMKGPTIMLGYWDMPEKTAETIRDGWLYSGDMGRVDEEGFLYIMGRSKDMIISGGENIYPPEIERVIREYPRVKDVAVVGIPDPEWGESVLAVVVPEEGPSLAKDGIVEFVRGRLAGFKKPKFVEFVESLPVTAATGKVRKAELRKRYADLAAGSQR